MERKKDEVLLAQFDPNFEKLVTLVSLFVVSPCFATSSTPPLLAVSKKGVLDLRGVSPFGQDWRPSLWADLTDDPLFGWAGPHPTRLLTTGQIDSANSVPNRLG